MKLRVDYNIPDKVDFFNLFETTGWNKEYRLSPGLLYEAIKNSWFYVCVYNDEKLIGFGRVISDGVLHALIVDLIVAPDLQKCGIGKLILNELVTKCKASGISDIQLFSAKGKEEFYIKQGFRKRSNDSPGMEFQGFDSK